MHVARRAAELPQGVAILADDLGRLLILPYSGDELACLDLADGGLAYPLISLGRVVEYDLRTASVRLLAGWGVLYLTEAGMYLFGESLELSWMVVGNFMGWSIEKVVGEKVLMLTSDWSGRDARQVISLRDGRPVSWR